MLHPKILISKILFDFQNVGHLHLHSALSSEWKGALRFYLNTITEGVIHVYLRIPRMHSSQRYTHVGSMF